MTDKIKSFFLTSAKAESFNKVTSWVVLGGSLLVLAGIILLVCLYLQFKSSFKIFNEYDVPIINFLFNDFYLIIGVFLFFVFYALLIFPGLYKQKNWGYYNFFIFNFLLIIINLSFIYFGKLFNADIQYVSKLINYLPEETESLIFSLNMSYFFQGVILSLLHTWLIWRYGQGDMRGIFVESRK